MPAQLSRKLARTERRDMGGPHQKGGMDSPLTGVEFNSIKFEGKLFFAG
jgi:hypothetical protein